MTTTIEIIARVVVLLLLLGEAMRLVLGLGICGGLPIWMVRCRRPQTYMSVRIWPKITTGTNEALPLKLVEERKNLSCADWCDLYNYISLLADLWKLLMQ